MITGILFDATTGIRSFHLIWSDSSSNDDNFFSFHAILSLLTISFSIKYVFKRQLEEMSKKEEYKNEY